MENKIGINLKQYEGVIVSGSVIGDEVILGTDSYVQNSQIGNYCRIERRGMVFDSIIRDYSYTGFNSIIKNSKVGKFCSISWGVSVGGADHDYKRFSSYPFKMMKICETGTDFFQASCNIGNDVWIGAGATILNGVTVGDGVVVGAETVVTKEVPPYAIIVGNPGKVIRYRFSDNMIDDLLNIRWWDWPKNVLLENIEWLTEKQLDEKMLERMKIISEII